MQYNRTTVIIPCISKSGSANSTEEAFQVFFVRMYEHGDGDLEESLSGTFRPSFALGRGLPGWISLNPPQPGRLTSLRSRHLTLGGYKKKTFVPNVHSVRKTKDERKLTLHQRKRGESKKTGKERDGDEKSHRLFSLTPSLSRALQTPIGNCIQRTYTTLTYGGTMKIK
ncbi:DNA-directed RNA polymerase III subunit RPC4-like isoform X1 [Myxocyprinus asiaticus]|uniref:DNA-directed RNA polymerase III subunit RPC4-like isoform X1 n=1 Tax=Myxocyprinus asiaticus TaxID=70543 RepID=UPI0022235034|nr:DNA-directed RNA polymerase III subunit RPC4-like isoform X1 [Myxocyprinus asiaticus]